MAIAPRFVTIVVVVAFALPPLAVPAQDGPAVDVEALVARIEQLEGQLIAEAQGAIRDEGATEVIERLCAEAELDERVAFARLNLAAVVAALAGDDEGAAQLLGRMPAAATRDVPLALARHAALIGAGLPGARDASAIDLMGQGLMGPSYEACLARFGVILAGVEALAPESLDLATCLYAAGRLREDHGSLDRALDYYRRSLAIYERLDPESLETARVLRQIGDASWRMGTFNAAVGYHEALGYYERSLAIVARLAPDSLWVAGLLARIGGIYGQLGDGDAQFEYGRRALMLVQRLSPSSEQHAAALTNMAGICQSRGDIATALDYYSRALAVLEGIAPGSREVADVLVGIATLYDLQGAGGRAVEFWDRALGIFGRIAPDSSDMAWALSSRGWYLLNEGDYGAALRDFERSLTIFEHRAPGSVWVAQLLSRIGIARWARGEMEEGLSYIRQAVAIFESMCPISADMADAMSSAGLVQMGLGDLDAAVQHFERSLEIEERLPVARGVHRAVTLSNLGRVYLQLGGDERAVAYLRQAVQAWGNAREHVVMGDEVRSSFLESHVDIYHNLITGLFALGEFEEAADVAERMRARSFLDLMVERPIAGSADNPQLAARQAEVDARRDRLHAQLTGSPGDALDAQRAAQLSAELQRVELAQEVLANEARRADPRYATLQYPEPMTVAQLREALDPGTVVLSYVVGEEFTGLFVFGPGLEATAHEIDLVPDALGERVDGLLSLVAQGQQWTPQVRATRVQTTVSETGGGPEALARAAGELGEVLLGPAREQIDSARRLLILPDGPLWALPFQALLVDGDTWLCDLKPVHFAPSATVFAEQRRLREPAGGGHGLVALGSPDYQTIATEDAPGLPAAIRASAFRAVSQSQGQLGFAPLPCSGAEVRTIGELFSPSAQVLEGAAASELSLRASTPGRQVLHLACHGLLDTASPMDSALVLSSADWSEPGADGLLKAWEVFDLDLAGCDLVTLSACETARGQIYSGEGVIGLTRAFLYAGAASVLCTQWQVADSSTAALMARFYAHYTAGVAKDEALRMAMREIRTGRQVDGAPLRLPPGIGPRREQWTQPYYWAPFILVGEWRTAAASPAAP